MHNTALNPDALEAAASVLCDETAGPHTRYADLKTGLAKKLWGQRAEHVVSAYLAVAQPEVNSVEELDALPVGTIIEDSEPCVLRLSPDSELWFVPGSTQGWVSEVIELPATVLYRPVEG